MNREFELKVQAFLDGELSKRESRRVERQLALDQESSWLLEELRWTKNVLAANEPSVGLSGSREYYWHGIEREILRAERATASEPTALPFSWLIWKKCLAPLSGLALAALVVLGILEFYSFDASGPRSRFLAQVESPSEEMGAFSFRSQSDNIFVIWLYERSSQKHSEISLVNDMFIQ
jgi:hypothetical protein